LQNVLEIAEGRDIDHGEATLKALHPDYVYQVRRFSTANLKRALLVFGTYQV
jgi:hypothetical protein